MARLVDYSSDEEKEHRCPGDDPGARSRKRSRSSSTEHLPQTRFSDRQLELPPLPDDFLREDGGIESVDDSALSRHAGRMRSVPHIAGNWATSVYIKITPVPDFLILLKKLCIAINETLVAQGGASVLECIKPEDLHISLSRTVYLKVFQIDRFVAALFKSLHSSEPFWFSFQNAPSSFVNDERTRSFLGLEVARGHRQVLDCLHRVDEVMKLFDLPTFYVDPRPHASFCWALGDVLQADLLRTLPISVQELAARLSLFEFEALNVICKAGNQIYPIAFDRIGT